MHKKGEIIDKNSLSLLVIEDRDGERKRERLVMKKGRERKRDVEGSRRD